MLNVCNNFPVKTNSSPRAKLNWMRTLYHFSFLLLVSGLFFFLSINDFYFASFKCHISSYSIITALFVSCTGYEAHKKTDNRRKTKIFCSFSWMEKVKIDRWVTQLEWKYIFQSPRLLNPGYSRSVTKASLCIIVELYLQSNYSNQSGNALDHTFFLHLVDGSIRSMSNWLKMLSKNKKDNTCLAKYGYMTETTLT